jgi:putative endopeptidase
MDTETLDEKGITPLVPSLARISEVATTQALTQVFGRSQREGTASPLSFYVGADRSDPDQHQLVLSIGGLGLPDRDYYLLDTDEYKDTRSEYVAHIERMLGFADVANADAKAAAVLSLETKLAELIWPRSQRRDRDLTYNPMTYLDFVGEYPGLDWDAYFSAAGIENLESLNVSYPSAMAPLIALISEAYVDDWVSYVTYHHISSNADLLSTEINQENFFFYSTILNGVPKQRERWERAVAKVGSLSGLGEPVGQVYVQQHFPESAKEKNGTVG